MIRRLIVAFVMGVLALPGLALAAGEAKHPEPHPWSFNGPFGAYDRAAVQRGYYIYKQVCSACHGMRHLSYRHLGDPGGPFEARWMVNEDTGVREQRLASTSGPYGRFVEPAENQWVRAIAASVDGIPDVDDRGAPLDGGRSARPEDRFKYPFANEAAGRAANNGAYPPDLSVITKARHYGADYIRSLLLGYQGDWRTGNAEQKEGKYVNIYFPGGVIGMAPPLTEASVGNLSFTDGSTPTLESAAEDVVQFFQWAADPHMQERKTMGVQVLAFLLVLSLLLFLAYKQVWRNTEH